MARPITKFIVALAGIALTGSVALAQRAPLERSDSSTKASTQMTTGATGNMNDVGSKTFIEKAAITDQFEIESSKLALQKASDPQVKQFAQQMIDEHTRSSDKLKATLESAGGVAPQIDLDAKHGALMDKLHKASGKEFDSLYVKIQRDGHKEAVGLFRKYSKAGKAAPLKGFAQETLPVIEKHLQHVQGLKV
jgi:putative membrane protein